TRQYYLSDMPLSEALQKFHEALAQVGALALAEAETLALDQAQGRVTASPVWAARSSPHYDAAAMDGVAVRARETIGATETAPLRLKVGEQAVWVDTGDPMPPGFDAVIMIEVIHQVDASTIEIQTPVAPYQHVRPLGEDIVATELVLAGSHRLRPQDLAACAAAGLTAVAVRQPPHVAVIPTGTELVPIGTEPRPGDIVEFNSLMLGAMIAEWGGRATRWPSIPDDYDRLKQTILAAVVASDIVVINAGSSAGSEDYTARAVADLGQLVVHGVAVRPGHPVVLGVVCQKSVVGIPGYPVSAALTCELFVKPLIEHKLGLPPSVRHKITAHISRKVLSPTGEDEYLRVRLGRVGTKMVATPIQRGAGVIMSLVRADGLVIIPRFSEGLDAGQEVTVELLCSPESLEATIVAIGSHDLTLDLLASELRCGHPNLTLTSSNVGSLGGLLALHRGEAHLAGSHLLDEATGEYNLAFVRRYVPERALVVVNLVHRIQGFIVPPGNPKSIATLADLTRDGITFVNRQRGSGTRVLLDYLLKQQDIAPARISGYEREEFTHLAVAAAVAGGRVDVGLGILSAARALGMDFIALRSEQYDLVIPREFYHSELFQPLLALIRSQAFQQQVAARGGYDVSTMGEVVAELP
ncbi:MAG TPA: molybdopterin biosynthesis protein, partial [Candidatus Tectomicrobia bacterium]